MIFVKRCGNETFNIRELKTGLKKTITEKTRLNTKETNYFIAISIHENSNKSDLTDRYIEINHNLVNKLHPMLSLHFSC